MGRKKIKKLARASVVASSSSSSSASASTAPPLPSRTEFFEPTSKEQARHSSSSGSSSSATASSLGLQLAAVAAKAAEVPYRTVAGPSTTKQRSLAATDEHRWRTVTDDSRHLASLSPLQGFSSDTDKMEFG
ncbi:hypothetical protein AND_007391 [Anopheles darlingi]|uniref:Uncharacterized protein n=1 Tax=Anopheles darlingi TaxID=43151 RepID=W5JAF8_ANODA|nr:hypothetical protein AND_007391 [Anopheles darlingi]